MKLVIEYTVGDDFTWSDTVVHTLEYESPEALIVDFMDAHREAVKNDQTNFKFLNKEFDVSEFRWWNKRMKDKHGFVKGGWEENPPDIYTLDEFFENQRIDKQ